MIDLLGIYICVRCGEVLEDEVESVEIIDTDRDDVWVEKIHKCGCAATRKYVEEDGVRIPCFRSVAHERWLWASGFYADTLGEIRAEFYD